ncbi:hypothetical protein MKL09_06320 [Methylobacterium sp. J-048]|uniref:hypothetical protein n=1 Tax=Methylobacterium sp. J-048 TaxID=2836635 RepID=UPI001FBB3660|nr:hypothetical protein [Methylobacterium sp. J-048]MCJ2056161.1 hypothetical protein [Methylobacterium sp. J-048]
MASLIEAVAATRDQGGVREPPQHQPIVNQSCPTLVLYRSSEAPMALDGNRPHPGALARYPVPIELISGLFRADDEERDHLLARMPSYGRARIAAYCAVNERLEELGLKVARTCDEAMLARAAGPVLGADLFIRSRRETAIEPQLQAA